MPVDVDYAKKDGVAIGDGSDRAYLWPSDSLFRMLSFHSVGVRGMRHFAVAMLVSALTGRKGSAAKRLASGRQRLVARLSLHRCAVQFEPFHRSE
jgi:hypothetical protein